MRVLSDRPEVWPYILASLFFHLLLVFLLPWGIAPAGFDEKPIEVFAIEDVPEHRSGKTPYRIADIARPAVEQKPKDAKFLGMYDSAVPEEQVGVSRSKGEGGQGGKLKTRIGEAGPGRKSPEAGRPKKSRKKASTGTDRLYAFNKDLFTDSEGPRRGVEEEGSVAPGAPGGMDDFYPDFRRGAHTYLNVLRYPGVEYFVRMKRAFKIAFNPSPSLGEHFSRNIVSRGSVEVVLGVSVGRDGNLSELFVFRSSGIPAYDQESMRTVRVSAPFASPPGKFLSDDGMLRMTWTFTVYL
ncbi:MAG TPA: energy transducer TonB [bacterium]|nr:energy transducer TonB [bacterium]